MAIAHSAVDPGPTRTFDGARAWARPLGTALAVLLPAGLLAVLHPAASLIVLLPAAFVAWRLHGSGLEPWKPHRVDRFPNSVTDGRLRRYAADLRWRWEHGMVVGGLGVYDDGGRYTGPVLTAVSQHGDAVVAHASLPEGTELHDVHARTASLAAGLEAAETSVLGGEQGTVALLIREREPDEGWT